MPSLRWSLLVAILLAAARAQAPDQPVMRITVNLVQVDAVVTDGKGRQVADLKAEDFEVVQDGKPHKVTHADYIRTAEAAPAPPDRKAAAAGARRIPGPLPPAAVRREQVHRSIALVVDDMNMPFESTVEVRRALHKYIDEQLQPGDLAAIIRTGGDAGAVQQFTSDKRRLHAAADMVRWYWQSSAGDVGNGAGPTSGQTFDSRSETIRHLIFIAHGLQQLPGRRSIVLFEEADLLQASNGDLTDAIRPEAEELFNRFLDASSRASAPIYIINSKGLPTLALRASENIHGDGSPTSNSIGMAANAAMSGRTADYLSAGASLGYIAKQTGGLYYHGSSNDLSVPLRQAIDDQQGYYLLGYTPDPSTFDAKTGQRKFHKITVRLTKRKGLSVRAHSGFLGMKDEATPPPAPGSTEALAASLSSPFEGGDIEVGMTSLFFNTAEQGSFITTLANVKAGGLTFREGPDGRREMEGDIAALAFGDNGVLAEKTATTFKASLSPEEYKRALADGFLLTLNMPAKKPGPYDVRVAVRDKATSKIGTAGEFVLVPELKKEHMALSGILLETPAPKGGAADTDLRGGTALRIFHPGDTLTYGYVILNPKLDPSKKPRLESRIRLYRDGQEVYSSETAPVPVGTDVERLLGGGNLSMAAKMPPGDYVLQAEVTDLLAAKADSVASQYINFRVTQ